MGLGLGFALTVAQLVQHPRDGDVGGRGRVLVRVRVRVRVRARARVRFRVS